MGAVIAIAADVIRIAIIFYGGVVAGGGTIILHERARFYLRAELREGAYAMYALTLVNLAVMAYIAAAIVSRVGHNLTWRAAGAIAIFTLKAVFFRLLRDTGLEQERRLERLFQLNAGRNPLV